MMRNKIAYRRLELNAAREPIDPARAERSFDIDPGIEAESLQDHVCALTMHSRSSLGSICRLLTRVSPARNEGARDSCVRMEERGEISLTPFLAFSRGPEGQWGVEEGTGESASLKF